MAEQQHFEPPKNLLSKGSNWADVSKCSTTVQSDCNAAGNECTLPFAYAKLANYQMQIEQFYMGECVQSA